MGNIRYASFAKNEFQLIAVLLALRSLQLLDTCSQPPMIMVPKSVVEQFELKFPKFKVHNAIRKLGGEYKESFSKGYNPRNAFRVALTNISRKLGDDELLYFAPTTLFFGNIVPKIKLADFACAKSQDDYWPKKELYGPNLEAIWSSLIEFADGNTNDWINPDHSSEYWRRYPCATTQIFYARDAKGFADEHAEISKSLIDAKLPVLEGQGRDLVEPSIALSLFQSSGKLVDLAWDHDLVAYDNFIQLILRLNPEHANIFYSDILDQPLFRGLLKRSQDYKYYFYHNALNNIRDKLDDVESKFSPLRINQLIEARNLDRKIRNLIKEGKLEEASGVKKDKPIREKKEKSTKDAIAKIRDLDNLGVVDL